MRGGILLRIAPPIVALFAGCALVGSAIALLNVLMPGLVKRDYPDRAASMTALYSTTLILGATGAAASAVPLENALGSWQGSLASWGGCSPPSRRSCGCPRRISPAAARHTARRPPRPAPPAPGRSSPGRRWPGRSR
ncbi:hypothetical protein GCM10020000_39480 [Streptomyces olivoverticillatus]